MRVQPRAAPAKLSNEQSWQVERAQLQRSLREAQGRNEELIREVESLKEEVRLLRSNWAPKGSYATLGGSQAVGRAAAEVKAVPRRGTVMAAAAEGGGLQAQSQDIQQWLAKRQGLGTAAPGRAGRKQGEQAQQVWVAGRARGRQVIKERHVGSEELDEIEAEDHAEEVREGSRQTLQRRREAQEMRHWEQSREISGEAEVDKPGVEESTAGMENEEKEEDEESQELDELSEELEELEALENQERGKAPNEDDEEDEEEEEDEEGCEDDESPLPPKPSPLRRGRGVGRGRGLGGRGRGPLLASAARSLVATPAAATAASGVGGAGWVPPRFVGVDPVPGSAWGASSGGILSSIGAGSDSGGGSMDFIEAQPAATTDQALWERETRMEQERVRYQQNWDPLRWVCGIVKAVKNFGIFVTLAEGFDVMVPVSQIPQEFTAVSKEQGSEERIPDLLLGDEVELRILAYLGADAKGKDRYRCSMLPPSGGGADAAAGKGVGKHAERQKSGAAAAEMEVMPLAAKELAEKHGRTDRRAYLAARGFTVVDQDTLLQLQEVYKSPDQAAGSKGRRSESSAEAKGGQGKPQGSSGRLLMVSVMAGMKGKPIGHIAVQSGMGDAEKKRMALDLGHREANDCLRNGTNVARVDITDKVVNIRLKNAAGLQF
mmetsp:Transcript_111952/g.280485  ORF Transcript_111952/g.280485 Transcript_111952/m.280485 type:complete len:661 (+) Transcript_111952:153-2135(+)